MTVEQAIDQCRVEGTTVFLPDIQLDRDVYLGVKKKLEGIGGKWNRKASGFVFPSDPSSLLDRVQDGEKINLKKDFQFFRTPDALADQLVLHAMRDDAKLPNMVLEPSAGDGSIIKAIQRAFPGKGVFAYEINPEHRKILNEMNVFLAELPDFLLSDATPFYKTIIANPPFTKNQDIDHFRHMMKVLEPNGKIVSVMSNHWRFAQDRKSVEFADMVNNSSYFTVIDLPEGTFKESGTNIACCILIYDRS